MKINLHDGIPYYFPSPLGRMNITLERAISTDRNGQPKGFLFWIVAEGVDQNTPRPVRLSGPFNDHESAALAVVSEFELKPDENDPRFGIVADALQAALRTPLEASNSL
jgi:hypothetical protein